MGATTDLMKAMARVVGGSQPDAVNKPYWWSGKDVGDSTGMAGLTGAWWPAPPVIDTTPVALILQGQTKLLQPFPMQGHKQVENTVHVRIMIGHADPQLAMQLIADFNDLIPSIFDAHMQLFGAVNVTGAYCGDSDLIISEWGGSAYTALEFPVRVQRVLPVTYQP